MDYYDIFPENFTVLQPEQLNLTADNYTKLIAKSVRKSKLYQIPPLLENILFASYGAICAIALLGNTLVLCLVVVSAYIE